jgi:hypothetical protein
VNSECRIQTESVRDNGVKRMTHSTPFISV